MTSTQTSFATSKIAASQRRAPIRFRSFQDAQHALEAFTSGASKPHVQVLIDDITFMLRHNQSCRAETDHATDDSIIKNVVVYAQKHGQMIDLSLSNTHERSDITSQLEEACLQSNIHCVRPDFTTYVSRSFHASNEQIFMPVQDIETIHNIVGPKFNNTQFISFANMANRKHSKYSNYIYGHAICAAFRLTFLRATKQRPRIREQYELNGDKIMLPRSGTTPGWNSTGQATKERMIPVSGFMVRLQPAIPCTPEVTRDFLAMTENIKNTWEKTPYPG